MIGFEQVARIDEITPARPKRVAVGDRECVLFKVGEQLFAIENLCPHQRYSVFHQAVVDHYIITCPMHSWSFDLRTGKAVSGGGRLKTFECRVENNIVWVKNEDAGTNLSD